MSALLLILAGRALHANPTGGSVAQGSATFSSSGSQFNINQSSADAFINWQSFNIGAGETVNFNQPSASSVTWNQINDPNPSQILGSLNANGYVVLQNSSGFYVGGQASITAHGLVMTTASTPALNLSSGGPWSFNTPPPTAKIVNYGQINIAGGGSAYLIANDIENNGTISAPGGKIGLYAGQKVLVSTSPDGRGLSAEATIPQGLVDNNGKLVANAGSIALQAQMVNQNGLIQANSARDVNGTIELVGGDSVHLGANSVISAQGDTQGASPGGSVTIQGGNSFSDQAGSVISVAGGAQGGNGGQVEISASQLGDIQSQIDGHAAPGFLGGALTLDPTTITLDSSTESAYNTTIAGGGLSTFTVSADDIYLAASWTTPGSLLNLNLTASDTITIGAVNGNGTVWNLGNLVAPGTPSVLTLSAGNNIILPDGSAIVAPNNWTLNLFAGTSVFGGAEPNHISDGTVSDGIYLNGGAYLQTGNGGINLYAANEVQVGWSGQSAGTGNANSGSGAIRTIGGGNINVTAQYGDVNSGSSAIGYNFQTTAPYYLPNLNLGGISTAAGGNVTINAGGNVISFNDVTKSGTTTTVTAGDAGTGAFDPTRPGNVTITAGGSVYGHFVEADGTGTINAGQNIGTALQNVALSLVNGGWNLNAQNNIYLQEVRNPNGVFDNLTAIPPGSRKRAPTAGNHLFDYNPQAWTSLTAGNGVYLTGYHIPRPNDPVPLLLPPSLIINAGPGGVVLDTPSAVNANGNDITPTMAIAADVAFILFPSPYQNLQITTTGGGWLSSGNPNGTDASLLMSDSGLRQWTYNTGGGFKPFGRDDHASVPLLLNNDNPVSINLTGSQLINGIPVPAGMENIALQTDKATQINVAGDMIGCSFYGENLRPGDVTSINVGGQIYNAGSFTTVTLAQNWLALPAADTPTVEDLGQLSSQGVSLSSWYLALILAVNPNSDVFDPKNSYTGSGLSFLLGKLNSASLYGSLTYNSLVYNPDTKSLTVIGPMPSDLLAALESPYLYVPRYGANGYPVLDANGHFVLDKINWVPNGSANASLIASLSADSQQTVGLGAGSGAYVVGGTGEFNVTAGSISLGNSLGILSVGNGHVGSSPDYSFLAPYITSAANINVTAGYLEMPASTIASLARGGNVTVACTGEIPNSPLNDNGVGVSMDLGSQDLLSFEAQIMNAHSLGLGIYTTGGGDTTVTAPGTINVDSSRIGTFDGGNVNVESLAGDVNAGSGGTLVVPIYYSAPDYFGNNLVEYVPANGIVAGTLTAGSPIPPGAVRLPGNITVSTPEGNIYASSGGIFQVAYNEVLSTTSGFTSITLAAGSDGHVGNIILGNSGVIGINVIASATGNITGLIISQQNADINAAGNFAGTVFSGGKTTLSSGGTISGTIVAVGGLNTSGGGNLSATVFTTSVNGGAGTLATSASASSASQSAAGQTSAENQQQVASNSEPEKKKKKKKELVRTVGRVTVILPEAS